MDGVAEVEEEPENAELSDDERLRSADPLKLYVRQLGDGRLLTQTEERELARRKDLGDEAAKRRLVESNLRLVMSITRRYTKAERPAARPDPGGQSRPDPRGREVRLQARLQALDLRDLVDPPGDQPRALRPGTHDPAADAHRRAGAEGAAGAPPARAEAEPRPDVRGDRPRVRPHGGSASHELLELDQRPGLARDAGRRRREPVRRPDRGRAHRVAGRRDGHGRARARAERRGASRSSRGSSRSSSAASASTATRRRRSKSSAPISVSRASVSGRSRPRRSASCGCSRPACGTTSSALPRRPRPVAGRVHARRTRTGVMSSRGMRAARASCPSARGPLACAAQRAAFFDRRGLEGRRSPASRFDLRRARSASRSKPSREVVRGSGKPVGSVDESATGSANPWSRPLERRARSASSHGAGRSSRKLRPSLLGGSCKRWPPRLLSPLHRARSASRSKLSPGAVRGSGKPTGSGDESATGSVNFFCAFCSSSSSAQSRFRAGGSPRSV